MGLHPRGLSGCGLVAEGFVGFWWCAGLWVAPWVGCRLGFVDGGGCGLVVVRFWVWVWALVCRFSGCCGLLVWVVLGLGLGLGFGVAWVLLVGQTLINKCWYPPWCDTVPDQ